jgi:hypothetical protein
MGVAFFMMVDGPTLGSLCQNIDAENFFEVP